MRYHAAKSSSSSDASSVAALHDLVPTRLAAEVWNCISKYRSTIPEYPQKETCELLIVDRTIDQVLTCYYFSLGLMLIPSISIENLY